MTDEKPILSIIIPTRNREKYCINAINHILSLNEMDFELVIQDNSDSHEIMDYVANLNDTRLKYHYTENRLNSLINMDFAISLANGKYVIMIGDDDTVLPTIFKVVEYANKFNYDSISQKNVIPYYWPDSLGAGSSGELHIIHFSCEKEKPDLSKNLDLFLKNGMIDYLSFSFPKVYHGIVSKKLLDKIKNKTGHFFGGLSPDIYSAISLSFFAQNFIVIDYPFTIGGVCHSSTTAQNMTGGHRGELDSAPHLILRGNYIWDKQIPAYYSVETIWAESAIKSIIELEKGFLLNKFRFSYFILFSLWRGKGIRKLIIKEVFKTRNSILKKIFLFLNILLATISFAIDKFPKIRKNKFLENLHILNGTENLDSATEEIMKLVPNEFPFSN